MRNMLSGVDVWMMKVHFCAEYDVWISVCCVSARDEEKHVK